MLVGSPAPIRPRSTRDLGSNCDLEAYSGWVTKVERLLAADDPSFLGQLDPFIRFRPLCQGAGSH